VLTKTIKKRIPNIIPCKKAVPYHAVTLLWIDLLTGVVWLVRIRRSSL